MYNIQTAVTFTLCFVIVFVVVHYRCGEWAMAAFVHERYCCGCRSLMLAVNLMLTAGQDVCADAAGQARDQRC